MGSDGSSANRGGVGILPGFLERDQPVGSCLIVFIRPAKCLGELSFLCPDEDHDTDVQED